MVHREVLLKLVCRHDCFLHSQGNCITARFLSSLDNGMCDDFEMSHELGFSLK